MSDKTATPKPDEPAAAPAPVPQNEPAKAAPKKAAVAVVPAKAAGGTLTVGKYRGLSFQSALERDADYCGWVVKNATKSKGSLRDFADWLSARPKSPEADPGQRIYLNVSFQQSREAKGLGAKWDESRKMWYAPDDTHKELLEKFPIPRELALINEDRGFGGGLVVEMAPATCPKKSVENCIMAADWEDLRRVVLSRAGRKCEACGGGEGVKSSLRVHDRWSYDSATQIRKLVRLMALCPGCMGAVHMTDPKKGALHLDARAHFQKVSGCSEADLDRHLAEVFADWVQRSKLTWSSDLSLLVNAGLPLIPE